MIKIIFAVMGIWEEENIGKKEEVGRKERLNEKNAGRN